MNRELIISYLTTIAAQANRLAQRMKLEETWAGEVSREISSIRGTVEKASDESRSDR